MILFSSSGSNVGGIVKVVLAIGAAIIGLVRTCGRSADDVADIARVGRRADNISDLRYGDEISDMRHFDDAIRSTKGGLLKLDDAYTLTDQAAKSRLVTFEVSHLQLLDEGSHILQSYNRWKGYSPSMTLKMMQIDLMPPSVRRVMMEPGGEELYAAMIGRKIDATEAQALRQLFGPSVKATEKNAERFVYLREGLEESTTARLIRLDKQLHNASIPDKNITINHIEVCTPNGSQAFEEATESAAKAIFDKKTTITEWLPNVKSCFKLIKIGLKLIHHAPSFASQKDVQNKDYSYLIYAPESNGDLMNHYGINEEEAKLMRADLNKLAKLKWVHLISDTREIPELMKDSKQNFIMICQRSNFSRSPIPLDKSLIWLDVSGYSFHLENDELRKNRGVCFEPLAKAMLSLNMKKEMPSNQMFENLATNYVEFIEKNNNHEVRALVYINAQFARMNITYSPLFQVVYANSSEIE